MSTRTRTLLMVGGVLVVLWLVAWQQGGTPDRPARHTGTATVPLADLPVQARETVRLIDRGGPYPYVEDGDTFGNREGLLPDHANGYYREFTVRTPGSSDRGARRIVAGRLGDLWWTDDHYGSFRRIERDGP